MKTTLIVIGAIVLLVIVGIIFTMKPADPHALTGQEPITLNASEIGDKWPLKVDIIEVYCMNGMVVAKAPGSSTVYAVNGLALQVKDEYLWTDLAQISIEGRSIDPILLPGLSKCQ